MPILGQPPRFVTSACKGNGALSALAMIIVIELLLYPYLTHNFISHEVDWTLRQLEKKNNNQPVVILGDSVGHGIFDGWKFHNGNVASLACNQATETAGQYFFLKRFLENNSAPGVVVSCDRTPLSGNLNQNLTENYIQRCFTRWSEIVELLTVKMDPVFTVKMLAYKFFATFKYRLHLQKKIVGFTNSDIYSGVTQQTASSSSDYGLIKVISGFIESFRQESISHYFFQKMIRELDTMNVPILYLPPPSRLDKEDVHRLIQSSENRMEELSKKHSNLSIISDQYHRLPEKYFGDDVHLNQEGLDAYRPLLQQTMEGILSDAVHRQQDMILRSFNTGRTLIAIDGFGGKNTLEPLNDAVITFADGRQIVESIGKDPALLLPLSLNIAKKRNERIVIGVTLASSARTTAKLYFSRKTDNRFTESDSVKQPVGIGRNSLFFVLPEEIHGGNLRFDPGECSGTFILEELAAKVVSEELIKNIHGFLINSSNHEHSL